MSPDPPQKKRPKRPGRLRRCYEQLGLLCVVVGGASLAALLLQRLSPLPQGYTVLYPLRLLRQVLGGAYFPTCALGVLLLGRLGRPRRPAADRGHYPPFSATGAAALLLLSGLLSLKLQRVDLVATGLLGALTIREHIEKRDLLFGLAEALLLALLLCLCSYTFTVFKALLFTVRPPRDDLLLAAERLLLGGHPHRLLTAWLAARPDLLFYCDRIYFWIFEHMVLASVLLIGMGRPRERLELMATLGLCYVLGGVAYYLLPGQGPVYAEPAIYAHLQKLPLITPIVQQRLLVRTTHAARGLGQALTSYDYIACMPSLHIAHELILVYYARYSLAALGLSCAFCACTMVAVLALGWHYAIDIAGGAALALVTVRLVGWQRGYLLPGFLMRARFGRSEADGTVAPPMGSGHT